LKQLAKYLLVAGILVAGCTDQELIFRDSNYYPLEEGRFWIYQVSEVIYSEVEETQELEYQLKFEITHSFLNAENKPTFVILKSKRNNQSAAWEYVETISARANDAMVVEIRNNVSFVKLSFPALKNKSWNSNTLNTLDNDEFLIEESNISYEVESIEFDNCIVVNQEDELDFLKRDQRKEVYSYNIGLVYKESFVILFDQEQFGDYVPASGVELIQRLIDHGKN
jgi:hypothetical protein